MGSSGVEGIIVSVQGTRFRARGFRSQWLYKTAPGKNQKRELAMVGDLVPDSSEGKLHLFMKLSPTARPCQEGLKKFVIFYCGR